MGIMRRGVNITGGILNPVGGKGLLTLGRKGVVNSTAPRNRTADGIARIEQHLANTIPSTPAPPPVSEHPSYTPTPLPHIPPPPPAPVFSTDPAADLATLADLLQRGILRGDEYDLLKARVLTARPVRVVPPTPLGS